MSKRSIFVKTFAYNWKMYHRQRYELFVSEKTHFRLNSLIECFWLICRLYLKMKLNIFSDDKVWLSCRTLWAEHKIRRYQSNQLSKKVEQWGILTLPKSKYFLIRIIFYLSPLWKHVYNYSTLQTHFTFSIIAENCDRMVMTPKIFKSDISIGLLNKMQRTINNQVISNTYNASLSTRTTHWITWNFFATDWTGYSFKWMWKNIRFGNCPHFFFYIFPILFSVQ